MGSKPEENRYGLVFSEPHSVNLVDIDGDGLKDIVTGKTYWSHHTQEPACGTPAPWSTGSSWCAARTASIGFPTCAADDTGIGRQVTVADVNGDGCPTSIVGGMKGSQRAAARAQGGVGRRVGAGAAEAVSRQ